MTDDIDRGSTRRSLLSGLAGTALLRAGGVGGAVPDTSAASALGTFEDGLDGWTAAGGEWLSRAGRRDWPPAMTLGEVALCVDPDGSTAPAAGPGVLRRRHDAAGRPRRPRARVATPPRGRLPAVPGRRPPDVPPPPGPDPVRGYLYQGDASRRRDPDTRATRPTAATPDD